jgi:hypothetical protein
MHYAYVYIGYVQNLLVRLFSFLIEEAFSVGGAYAGLSGFPFFFFFAETPRV